VGRHRPTVRDYAPRINTMTISGHPCALVRLRPKLAAQHPSIPSGTWHAVLPCNPMALRPEAEPGSVWVDVEGRLRKLPTDYFEFTEASVAAPSSSSISA
jgi:hypothetical protein